MTQPDPTFWERQFSREKTARKEAERLLEAKATELYEANQNLLKLNETLEGRIADRTRQLDQFFSLALDLLCIVNLEGRFVRLNPAWETTLGYTRAELKAGQFVDFIHPEDIKPSLEAFVCLKQGKEIAAFRNRYRCKDGGYRWIEWRAAPYDGDYVYAAARDVTEVIHYQEELELAKDAAEAGTRAKSQFLAHMSHEIRTPLNGILGLNQLLLEEDLAPKAWNMAESMRQNGHSLLAIINDILDFSKIEANKLELESYAFRVTEFTDALLDILQARAYMKGVRFAFVVDPDLPDELIGDAGRLRQVLLNLADNAIKFTKEGCVEVRWLFESLDGEEVVTNLEVHDTGHGIPAEDLETIFSSFHQAQGSNKVAAGGTGLGLPISQSIIRLMGSEITVESTLRVGSKFRCSPRFGVNLPLPAPASREHMARVTCSHPAERRQIVSMLHRFGYDIAPEETKEEALEAMTRADLWVYQFELGQTEVSAEVRQAMKAFQQGGKRLLCIARPNRGQTLDEAIVAEMVEPPLKFSKFGAFLRGEGTGRPATAKDVAKPERMSPTGKRLRLLVAEDNVVNQDLIKQMLAALGYDSHVVSDGKEALDALGKFSYAAVLMDLSMPELSGIDTTRLIREQGVEIPIIAVTANAIAGDRERCLEAGMDGYVSKPIFLNVLADELNRVVADTPVAPAAESAEEAAPEDRPIFAPEKLEALFQGNRTLSDRVVQRFLEQADTLLTKFSALSAAEQTTQAKATFHSLSGSAGNLGAYAFAEAASEVERACVEPVDPSKLQQAITQAERAYTEVRTTLEAYLQSDS